MWRLFYFFFKLLLEYCLPKISFFFLTKNNTGVLVFHPKMKLSTDDAYQLFSTVHYNTHLLAQTYRCISNTHEQCVLCVYDCIRCRVHAANSY